MMFYEVHFPSIAGVGILVGKWFQLVLYERASKIVFGTRISGLCPYPTDFTQIQREGKAAGNALHFFRLVVMEPRT